MVRGSISGGGLSRKRLGEFIRQNSGTPKMETSIGSVGEASATLPALASFFVVLAEEDES